MKTDEQRGPVGSWARRSRLAAGHPSADSAARAATAAGLAVTTAYLRGIESGAHRPSRELVERLAAFYGAEPPPEDARPDDGALAAILEAVAAGVEEGIRRALRPPSVASPAPPGAEAAARALERQMPPEGTRERRSGSSGRRRGDPPRGRTG